MKKIFIFIVVLSALYTKAQAPMSYSSTPDSASQSPRPNSTGTFQIQYQGGVYTNSSYYSICCMSSRSSALDLYRFNINIPLTASVTGVTASYTTTAGNGGSTNYKIDSICLINNFVKVGNYKRDSVNGPGGTYTNGGPADLWGAALTPSMVNSPHFGFRITLDTYGINTTIVGAFKLTVHYMLASGIKASHDAIVKPEIYCQDKKLIVKANQNEAKLKVCVYSLTGEKVAESSFERDGQLMLDHVAPGIYIYKYNSELQSGSAKFIME